MTRILLAFTAVLTMSACGSEPRDGVGGVSASEAQALNDAAAKLDAQTGAAVRADPGLNPAAIAAAQANRNRTTPQPATP